MDAIAAETNESNAGKNAAALEVDDIEEDEAAIYNKIPEEHDFFRYKYSCQKLNGRYQSAWEHKKFGTTTFDWWMERCDKEDWHVQKCPGYWLPIDHQDGVETYDHVADVIYATMGENNIWTLNYYMFNLFEYDPLTPDDPRFQASHVDWQVRRFFLSLASTCPTVVVNLNSNESYYLQGED